MTKQKLILFRQTPLSLLGLIPSLSWVLLALSLTLSGCIGGRYSPSEVGVWYELKSNEGISAVATRYQVPLFEIVKRNEIIDPEDLSPGMLIFIPGAKAKAHSKGEVKFPKMGRTDPVMRSGKRLIWPAGGTTIPR